MRWDAVILGQPLSTNHIYVNRERQVQKRGVPVVNASGKPVIQRYRALTDEALKYQSDAQLVFQTRRPSRWHPEGQIRIMFDFALSIEVDLDNAKKLLLDALKLAIEHDDKYFLTCDRAKETGHDRPFVIVTVDDDPTHH